MVCTLFFIQFGAPCLSKQVIILYRKREKNVIEEYAKYIQRTTLYHLQFVKKIK